MKQLPLAAALVTLLLAAAPAIALGISFDLPRLDFPTPKPPVSRACAPVTPTPPTCARTQK